MRLKKNQKEGKNMSVKYEKVIEIVRLKQIISESDLEVESVHSSFGVAHWLQKEIGDEAQELLVVICLSTKNKINSYSVVHKGSLNQSIAHPREIFQRALLSNSARIMVAHNHPGGAVIPSANDKCFTKRLIQAGEVMGIELLDHLIISSDSYYSFREEENEIFSECF